MMVFVTVVRYQSFTKAADELNLGKLVYLKSLADLKTLLVHAFSTVPLDLYLLLTSVLAIMTSV
ncbi:hypothetical protein JCM19239_6107 [Vibrio variabilis]|uniref:HTH lysR-type domain-containing protein n=1 Tax=Vibrio variabilis TaxID=990271 RepID=A0ABQ0JJT4_9VIBR|nr:hypothetical protein JCM19239_6107 [Vibrio variabilis]